VNLNDLIELEAIKRLKYRYMRCIDLKLWDEIGDCFTDDATVSYDDGRWARSGRVAIVELLRNGLGADVTSSHTVHHPEIDLTSATSATGIWALQDFVFNRTSSSSLHGAAYYHDEYRKVAHEWLIARTEYSRVFEHRVGLERRWSGGSGE
jgi:hypothetical protein